MTRLIDADSLKEAMKRTPTKPGTPFFKGADVYKCIDHAPTVDAVPVVRCKDCTGGGGMCGFFGQNDYCSYGEKAGDAK